MSDPSQFLMLHFMHGEDKNEYNSPGCYMGEWEEQKKAASNKCGMVFPKLPSCGFKTSFKTAKPNNSFRVGHNSRRHASCELDLHDAFRALKVACETELWIKLVPWQIGP